MTKPTTPKPKPAQPHPDDPEGFVAVETNYSHGSSCSQCALLRTKLCTPSPCYEDDRPDRASIHYIKKDSRRA